MEAFYAKHFDACDTVILQHSNNLTRGLLENNMPIDRVCYFVKEYQRACKQIKNEAISAELPNPHLILKEFTPKIWYGRVNKNHVA